jgi:pimeloyl-ACP methyl ester carboxylesterase
VSPSSAEYVEVRGHPTWVVRSGAGDQALLLLHGGMSNSDDLLHSLGTPLGGSRELIAFDRIGHGRTADTADPLHYAAMAEEVIAILEQVAGAPGRTVHLIGWSDGGIAALLAARQRPDLIGRQVLIGTNFHHSGITLGEISEDSPIAAGMRAEYARLSPDGDDHFPVVMRRFLAMAATEPTLTPADLADVRTPTLVLAGDDDMVRLDHTVALYEALPEAQLAVVPGASHAVPVEKPDLVARLVLDFLSDPVPPVTALPVRRAATG